MDNAARIAQLAPTHSVAMETVHLETARPAACSVLVLSQPALVVVAVSQSALETLISQSALETLLNQLARMGLAGPTVSAVIPVSAPALAIAVVKMECAALTRTHATMGSASSAAAITNPEMAMMKILRVSAQMAPVDHQALVDTRALGLHSETAAAKMVSVAMTKPSAVPRVVIMEIVGLQILPVPTDLADQAARATTLAWIPDSETVAVKTATAATILILASTHCATTGSARPMAQYHKTVSVRMGRVDLQAPATTLV